MEDFDDDAITKMIKDSAIAEGYARIAEEKARSERKLEILRDEMAGKAMIGLISHYGLDGEGGEELVRLSYKLADLMLAQRNKP
jgi:hypothetical protein